MKRMAVVFATVCALLPSLAFAEHRPDWISGEQLSWLAALGINPANDIEEKGNYHWRWRTRRMLAIAGYSCPVGTTVSISRTIIFVMAPENAACVGKKRPTSRMLKVLPDGSAEPL